MILNYLCRRFPAECLSRQTAECSSDGLEPVTRVSGQVSALGEVLAQEAIGVLVGAALPRAVWVAEVDRQSCLDSQLDVLSTRVPIGGTVDPENQIAFPMTWHSAVVRFRWPLRDLSPLALMPSRRTTDIRPRSGRRLAQTREAPAAARAATFHVKSEIGGDSASLHVHHVFTT